MKHPTIIKRISVSTALFAMSLTVVAPTLSHAGPENGTFEPGGPTGSIVESATQPGNWDITAPDGAIINYTSFDVGETEVITFIQGAPDARVLNRIDNPLPSNINGEINSDGIVYFLNRSGVIFGPKAMINTAGLYAAAADLSSPDFAAEVDRFVDAGGSVENRGAIRAALVHLIGRQVSNFGSIQTAGGSGDVIAMSAGDDVLVSSPGSGVVVMFSGAASDPGTAGVTNEGMLDAGAGQIALGAGDMYALAVSHPGTSTASQVDVTGTGDVVIAGDLNGAVNIQGLDIELGNGAIQTGGGNADLISGTGSIRSLDADDGTAEIDTAGGALTMSAGIPGIGSAAAGEALEVDLGGGAISMITVGAAVIASEGATDLAQSVVGGNLDLTASGTISDSGTVRVLGEASFTTTTSTASGNSITLDETASSFGTLNARSLDDGGAAASGLISIRQDGDISVGDVLTTGDAIIDAGPNGNLVTVGGTVVASTVDVKATGDVVITGALNGEVKIEGLNIDLENGAIQTGGATADLVSSTGTIRSLEANDGTAEIDTTGGTLTMSAGSGGIGNAAAGEAVEVDLDGGALSLVTTGPALIASEGATNLGQSVVGGSLDLTASGPISDSGMVRVLGEASFTTTTSTASGNSIILDETTSSFGSVNARTVDDTGAAANGLISIRQNADINLADLVTTGDANLDAGPDGDIVLANPIGRNDLIDALTLAGDLISVGEVTSRGDQSYTGARIILNDNLETLAGGSIVFDGAVSIPVNIGIATGGGFGNFNEAQVRFLSTLDGPGALLVSVRDNAQLFFGGNLGSTTPLGDLNFVSAGARSDEENGLREPGIVFAGSEVNALSISMNEPSMIPADSLFDPDIRVLRPTIVGTGPSLEFRIAQRFGTGVREKLVVTDGIDAGLLRIEAAEAALADLAALQIEVVAPLIELQLRALGIIELPPDFADRVPAAAGQRTAEDRGLDIVANLIFFSSAPILVGSGPQPFFVIGDANASGLTGPVQGFQRRLFRTDGGAITAADLFNAARYYDTTGFGPQLGADGSLLALPAIFGGFDWLVPVPVVARDVVANLPGRIGGGQTARLQSNRQLWGAEVLAFLDSARSFGTGDGLFGTWAAGTRLGLIGAEGSDLELAASALGLPSVAAGGRGRSDSAFQLSKPAARSALQLYEALQADAPQIISKLELAMELHEGDPTSEGLSSTLRSDPGYRDVAAYLSGYAQLLDVLQELYLSESEYAGLKSELLRDVAPSGLAVEPLVREFGEPRS